MPIVNIIKSILPNSFVSKLHLFKLNFFKSRMYRRTYMRWLASKVRKKEVIHVLFIAISPALWKVDSLYKKLVSHSRFKVDILIAPNQKINDRFLRNVEIEKLKQFFDKKCYLYHDSRQIDTLPHVCDVLIYPMPYSNMVPREFDFLNNLSKLFICCEYAFHSGVQNWAYNKEYQNMAWIDCYENDIVKQLSGKEKCNKGVNSYVTGLPFVDEFTKENYTSPWKYQDVPCKKIIWAPHWTIADDGVNALNYSNFLKIADFMLAFAQNQIGKIQFAFKPHPWLKRELYKHADWGQERTDAYYSAWENGVNTQLEQGEYVDLFMTSDAMVHDSSSFCCEYLLTGKPVFFMARNEKVQVSLLNEMAYTAFYSQYIGKTVDDLQIFLKEQVVEGLDPMKKKREDTVKKYLLPPNGKTAAENIIDVILGKS